MKDSNAKNSEHYNELERHLRSLQLQIRQTYGEATKKFTVNRRKRLRRSLMFSREFVLERNWSMKRLLVKSRRMMWNRNGIR